MEDDEKKGAFGINRRKKGRRNGERAEDDSKTEEKTSQSEPDDS